MVLLVYDLSPECIIIGMDKNKWLVKTRQKTKEREMESLLLIALELIEKYTDNPRCDANQKLLPVRANAVYNRDLKKVAKSCRYPEAS